MQTGQNIPVSGNSIYTLAQKQTTNNISLQGGGIVIVKGNGTELKDPKAIKGRARRKMITQKRALKLVDVAKRKGDREIKQQFWNAYHCQNNLTTTNGRQHGDYCKNRFCALCCSIRKAALINKYGPILNSWPDPHYVCLTIRAVPAQKLKWLVNAMYRAFDRINNKYQKREQRGKGIGFMGIKTLECEFNSGARTYNPHFNVLVPNKEVGEALRMEWSKIWGPKYVNAAIQYCEPVRSKEKVMIEVIKYGTKTFSEPDRDKKLIGKRNPKIYVAVLYNIVMAMKGKRIFERFGFNLPKTNTIKPKGGTITEVKHYIKWKYDLKLLDWVGEDTDGLLTNYLPDYRLYYLLEYCMDVLLE